MFPPKLISTLAKKKQTMLLYIQIIIALGLIAFPIIKTFLKGALEFNFHKGIIFGMDYDYVYFNATIDKEVRTFRMNTLNFHLAIMTCTMAWSLEVKGYE